MKGWLNPLGLVVVFQLPGFPKSPLLVDPTKTNGPLIEDVAAVFSGQGALKKRKSRIMRITRNSRMIRRKVMKLPWFPLADGEDSLVERWLHERSPGSLRGFAEKVVCFCKGLMLSII